MTSQGTAAVAAALSGLTQRTVASPAGGAFGGTQGGCPGGGFGAGGGGSNTHLENQ